MPFLLTYSQNVARCLDPRCRLAKPSMLLHKTHLVFITVFLLGRGWYPGRCQWPGDWSSHTAHFVRWESESWYHVVNLIFSSGCTMPASRSQTGWVSANPNPNLRLTQKIRTPVLNNCDVSATNNAGCGVQAADSKSYGPSFNANGGGW